MADRVLREFERLASIGDPGALVRLSVVHMRNGRYEDALCALSHSSFFDLGEYRAARDGFVHSGGRVLFHRIDGRDVFSLYGVFCHKPVFKNGRFVRFVDFEMDFHWDKDMFRDGKKQRFTQQDMVKRVKKLGGRVLPSAMYYHWCIKFLYDLTRAGDVSYEQRERAKSALDIFVDTFKHVWVLTSTRVSYGGQKIEHLYGMPEGIGKFEVNFELMGNSGYLLSLADEGVDIAKAMLGARQNVANLNQMYVNLGGQKGVYIWRSNQRGERAVGLGFIFDGFDVDAYISVNGPVRLVSSKNFS